MHKDVIQTRSRRAMSAQPWRFVKMGPVEPRIATVTIPKSVANVHQIAENTETAVKTTLCANAQKHLGVRRKKIFVKIYAMLI